MLRISKVGYGYDLPDTTSFQTMNSNQLAGVPGGSNPQGIGYADVVSQAEANQRSMRSH